MKHAVLIAMLASTVALPVGAANDSREKQMLRRMQQQMQQIEQARAQAEQEKAVALADKESAEREAEKLGPVTRQLAGERSARTLAERERKALQAELQGVKERMAELESKLAETLARERATLDTLAQTESAKKRAESELAGHQQDLKQCRTHNIALYGVGREMMEKYRDKSCHDALAQSEPFTGLKRVEVENLLETWRDRLDREKLTRHP